MQTYVFTLIFTHFYTHGYTLIFTHVYKDVYTNIKKYVHTCVYTHVFGMLSIFSKVFEAIPDYSRLSGFSRLFMVFHFKVWLAGCY